MCVWRYSPLEVFRDVAVGDGEVIAVTEGDIYCAQYCSHTIHNYTLILFR